MTSLVFYYSKENRYSLNALLGAIEKFSEIYKITFPLYFFKNFEEIKRGLSELFQDHKEILFFLSFLTPQFWEIKKLLDLVKPYKPKLILLSGGPHISAFPKKGLEMGFDYVFVGEGEETLFSFLEFYFLKNEKKPHLKGLGYKEKENPQIFGRAKPVSLDDFPPFSLKYNKVGPLEITRGCPFLCKYCQTPRLFGVKVRHRSLEKILFYTEALLKRGIRDLRFITPNAFAYGSSDGKTLNLEALKLLLSELHKLTQVYRGRIFFGSFPSEVRPEHVNEETINLIKTYCANDNLVIGAQTGSERMLEYLARGHTVDDVRRAVKLTLDAGLKAKVDFIFGLPEETQEDIKASLSFMEELAKLGAIIHAHTFLPLPQTPFMRKSPGKITPEIFNFIKKYLPKGKIFGEWEKQMFLAEKISKELFQSFCNL